MILIGGQRPRTACASLIPFMEPGILDDLDRVHPDQDFVLDHQHDWFCGRFAHSTCTPKYQSCTNRKRFISFRKELEIQ